MHKTIVLIFLSTLFLLTSCNSSGLKKEIVETYKNGNPKKEQFFSLSKKHKKEVIKEVGYYPNGQKKYVGFFKDGKKDGKWIFWFENGNKWSEGYLNKGIRTGDAKVYHENGKLFFTGKYVNGKKDGKWTFYDDNGKKVNEIIFKNGKKVKENN